MFSQDPAFWRDASGNPFYDDFDLDFGGVLGQVCSHFAFLAPCFSIFFFQNLSCFFTSKVDPKTCKSAAVFGFHPHPASNSPLLSQGSGDELFACTAKASSMLSVIRSRGPAPPLKLPSFCRKALAMNSSHAKLKLPACFPSSGRGLEGRAHQAACRRPRSGAEAGIRGTSHKSFVLVIN